MHEENHTGRDEGTRITLSLVDYRLQIFWRLELLPPEGQHSDVIIKQPSNLSQLLISTGRFKRSMKWSQKSVPCLLKQTLPPWPLLLVLPPGFPGWFGENTSLGNKYNMFAAELLLELTDQTHLDLLVLFQLGNRNKDNDGLLALHINLLQKKKPLSKCY